MANYDRQRTCAFTGHRASKLPWKFHEEAVACQQLKERIYDAVASLYETGVRHYICGMANGCDMYFGEAVLQLRDYREGITLEAAIPYRDQARNWEESLLLRYNRLLAESDCYTLISRDYTPGCMQRRNEYMVDHASVLLAAYTGSAGGTRNTILYALRSGVEVIQLPI